MERVSVAVAVFLLVVPLATAQMSTWKSDPAHSEADFTIRHLSISDVHGRFGDVHATIDYDSADVTQSRVSATVDVGSVTTGEFGRDDEIKSADFFGVDSFPTATFNSTAVSKNGDGLWIRGNLTLHGITRQVVLNVSGPDKPVKGPDGKPCSGFSATTTIDRTAFDIGSAFPASIVGDQVKLVFNLKIIQQIDGTSRNSGR
jgi:polyisoprenoid-binding protein YceI